MAESAFKKLASAEAEAEKIKLAGTEEIRAAIQEARVRGEELVAAARKNADDGLDALEKEFAALREESKENIEREINIKCALVRTGAEEKRSEALEYIFKGVTGSGN